MWLLLVSFGTITWKPFIHHERSPGTPEVNMWWEYMGTGERCFSSAAIGVFPDARYGNECSCILPPFDSNHMSYLTKTHWVESSQFPHCEQINDWYYFKSLFGTDLLNNKKIIIIWNTHILYPCGELYLLVMTLDLPLSGPSFLFLIKSSFQTQKEKFLFSGPLNLQLYLPNIRISPALSLWAWMALGLSAELSLVTGNASANIQISMALP